MTTLPVYRTKLADLLLDAVMHGASAGDEMPLAHETAAYHFHRLRTSLAEGVRLLWIAHDTQGYRYLGEIPDYASEPDGRYHPTAIDGKRLFVTNRRFIPWQVNRFLTPSRQEISCCCLLFCVPNV